MPLTAKGRKILKSMTNTYGGTEKAKRVFYASLNKGRIRGVEGGGGRGKRRSRRA